MSIEKIIEGYQNLQKVEDWKFVMVEYNHKRKPNDFQCHQVQFSSPEFLKETIEDIYRTFLSIAKKRSDSFVDYSSYESTNSVGRTSVDHELFKTAWQSLVNKINYSEESVPLSSIKASAYIFVGSYETSDHEDKKIYLITKKNPIVSFRKNKRKLFSGKDNMISQTKDPIVTLNKSFDCIVLDRTMFMINQNIESVLNLEPTRKKICNRCVDEIESLNIIENAEEFRRFSLFGQNPKKFSTYQSDIVNKLTNDSGKNVLVDKFKIPLNDQGEFILDDTKKAARFLSIICDKTKSDLFGDSYCEVAGSKPIQIPDH